MVRKAGFREYRKCARVWKGDARDRWFGFGDRKGAERGLRNGMETKREVGGQGTRDSWDRPLNFPSNLGVHDSCAVVPHPTRSRATHRFTYNALHRHGSAGVYGRSSSRCRSLNPHIPRPYATCACGYDARSIPGP